MVWLKISGFEHEYQISEKGDVRRCLPGEEPYIIKSTRAADGTRQINLRKNGVRKNFMLHNLYAKAFQVSTKTAKNILYKGYDGNYAAKARVRAWLLEKIQECEEEKEDGSLNDEILYLKSFLKQVSD